MPSTDTVCATEKLIDELHNLQQDYLLSVAKNGWSRVLFGSAVVHGGDDAVWTVAQLSAKLPDGFQIVLRGTDNVYEFGICWGNVNSDIYFTNEEEDEKERLENPKDTVHMLLEQLASEVTGTAGPATTPTTIHTPDLIHAVKESQKIYAPTEYDTAILESTSEILQRMCNKERLNIASAKKLNLIMGHPWPYGSGEEATTIWLTERLFEIVTASTGGEWHLALLETPDMPYFAIIRSGKCVVHLDA